jgi:hypothetical protein
VLSQEMRPIAVARLVHRLFSGFDRAVKALGLFKMDTVGDAYIAAGFLPAAAAGADPQGGAEEARRGVGVRDAAGGEGCEPRVAAPRRAILAAGDGPGPRHPAAPAAAPAASAVAASCAKMSSGWGDESVMSGFLLVVRPRRRARPSWLRR